MDPFARAPGADKCGRDVRLCPNSHTCDQKSIRLSPFEQTGQIRSVPTPLLEAVIGWGGEMERSLKIDMTRDKHVERCKQRAFDYLDRGDLKNSVASWSAI